MTQPFEGVRVLDFTQVFAGPFGSYQLAVLGADVIKIERPGGEDLRYSPPSKEWMDRGMAPMWLSVNANKRNLVLDLKRPEAIAVVKRMAETADVVMENFRPGVMDRFGIGYEALSAINPRLIYCAVSGFGQNGPFKNAPGYDGKLQATSGVMSITGHPEMGPTRAGFAVCDAIGGMTAAFGVSSALFQRNQTGRGQFVDISMLDAALAFLSVNVTEFTVADHKQGQYGNQAVSRRPTANLFKVKDGYILLAVNNERQFQGLMKAIGQEALLEDPRFVDWDVRGDNADALRAVIETAFAEAGAETWEQRLEECGAPCARIWTIDEAVAHPQLAHRDVLQTVDSDYGPMQLVASGVRLEHGGPRIDFAPPAVGAHTEAVLAEAGYSEAEIAEMLASGVAARAE